MTNVNEYLSTAESIVREAGAIAREMFGQVDILGDHGQGNMFTPADLAVNEHVCRRISDTFPNHDILSEESGSKGGDPTHRWILDPIDGTRHFHGGVPLYSISLALYINKEPVLGVVYNPETGQLFSAVAGKGASLNGRRIQCSDKRHLRDATVCIEVPHRLMPEMVRDEASRDVASLMGQVERIRIIGASALGLCYCASGAFDLYLNMSTGSKIWDVAAGRIILEESGATVEGTSESRIIGGPAELRLQLIQALSPSGREQRNLLASE